MKKRLQKKLWKQGYQLLLGLRKTMENQKNTLEAIEQAEHALYVAVRALGMNYKTFLPKAKDLMKDHCFVLDAPVDYALYQIKDEAAYICDRYEVYRLARFYTLIQRARRSAGLPYQFYPNGVTEESVLASFLQTLSNLPFSEKDIILYYNQRIRELKKEKSNPYELVDMINSEYEMIEILFRNTNALEKDFSSLHTLYSLLYTAKIYELKTQKSLIPYGGKLD